MTYKFIKTLALSGLTLSVVACGEAPRPATEETGPKMEAGDIHQAASQLASLQVLDVSNEGIPTFFKGHLGKVDQPVRGLTASNVGLGLQSALPGVAKLFRLDAANLVASRVSQDAFGNTFVRYGQTKNGLPVVGAELLLHVNRDGEIFAANGSARDGASLSATPTLSVARARSSARADAARSGSTVRDGSRLVYVRSSLDQGLYLAYELRVSGGEREGAPVDELVYVDADTGSVVDRHSFVHTALNRKVYTAANGSSTPGTLKRTEGSAPTGDTIVDGNYDKLGETYECYKNNFGRDSFDNAGAALISTVHYNKNYVNAYWNGTQMVYGDGDNVNSISLAIDADVTTHELTHAVTERTSNLTYSGQSGGLNEGMSDIFAAFCQSYKSGTWSTSNEVFMIGEDIWTPGTPGDALRYLYDPALDGDSLDYAPDYTSGVDVHYSSGVPNLAFTLLSRGGKHPRGKTTFDVTGVGVEKAGHIFYETNVNCLTPGSTYAQAKSCTELKAEALYDAATKASTTQAWDAVGVGATTPPPESCSTTTALTNGVPVTGIALATGGQKCYSLAVPAGQTSLKIETSGGTGDVDLYTKFASAPTTTSYDCRPYATGNAESCTVNNPAAGTYYVLLNAYASASGVSLTGTSSVTSSPGNALTNTVETSAYAGAAASWKCWTLTVPSGKTSLVFAQTGKTGATGDADLYVKAGTAPTTSSYTCRPYKSGSTESCTISSPAAGTWYACSYAYSAYTNVTMKGSY